MKDINLDKIMGYLGLLVLTAGTIHAIRLEAGNKSVVTYLGVLVVIYTLNSIFRLLNNKKGLK